MPFYYFKCSACNSQANKILTPEKSKETQFCPKCSNTLIRAPKGATSQVMEVLDNGFSAKAVIRYSDAETLFKERSRPKPIDVEDEI